MSASAINPELRLILAQQAGNHVLALIMQALQGLLESLDRRYPNTPAVSRRALQEHRQLLRAVRAGDAREAESLMHRHLCRLEGCVRGIEERLRRGRTASIPSLPTRRTEHAVADPLGATPPREETR